MLFSFPQILHTLIFVIPITAGFVTAIKDGIDLNDVGSIFPSIPVIVSQFHVKFFGVAVNATLILILLTSYNIFRWAGSQNGSIFMATLRIFAFASAFVTIAGLLGVIGFANIDDPIFQRTTSLMFSLGASSLHILHDVILSFVKKRRSIFALSYDAFLLGVVILHEFVTQHMYISITEYIYYFLILLKFPIFGSDMYHTIENHCKQM